MQPSSEKDDARFLSCLVVPPIMHCAIQYLSNYRKNWKKSLKKSRKLLETELFYIADDWSKSQ